MTRNGTNDRLRTAGYTVGLLGCLVLAAAFGDALWWAWAPGWPGGGFGFAGTLGFLTPTAWALTSVAVHRLRSGTPSALAPLVVTVPVALLSTAAVLTLLPGRNGKLLGSLGSEGPLWVEGQPTVCWGLLPGALLGAGAVAGVVAARPRTGSGRRRRADEAGS